MQTEPGLKPELFGVFSDLSLDPVLTKKPAGIYLKPSTWEFCFSFTK